MESVLYLYRYIKDCKWPEHPLEELDNVFLVCVPYMVFKETEKGYWIMDGKKKWVSKTAKKRFAYPTKEEALHNFIHRTKRSIGMMKWSIKFAALAVMKAEEHLSSLDSKK